MDPIKLRFIDYPTNLDLIRAGNLALQVNNALEEVRLGKYPMSELRDALIEGLRYNIDESKGVDVDAFHDHVIESYIEYLSALHAGKSVTMLLPSGEVTIPAD